MNLLGEVAVGVAFATFGYAAVVARLSGHRRFSLGFIPTTMRAPGDSVRDMLRAARIACGDLGSR